MEAIDRLIMEWAEEPKNPNKLNKEYRHAGNLKDPDILYYHRQAVKFVKAQQKYEEANKRGDWSERSAAFYTMDIVRKRFQELVKIKKDEKE